MMLPLIRNALISIMILLAPCRVFSQDFSGVVFSKETKLPIGFVNIGIISANVGTVSDETGHFSLKIDSVYNQDSLRFSMIGYGSKTFLVRQFCTDSIREIFLDSRIYELKEAEIVYHKTREIVLGSPVIPDNLSAGFAYNDLGCEMGIQVEVKKMVLINDINLDVASCTFDSVIYRLNIYQQSGQAGFINILTRPVYVSFAREKINKTVTFDLGSYSIYLKGAYLVTLELYKDLGEGSLQFWSENTKGVTWFKRTCEGKWHTCPGNIGMFLHAQLVK